MVRSINEYLENAELISELNSQEYMSLKRENGFLLHEAAATGNVKAVLEILALPFRTRYFNSNGHKPERLAFRNKHFETLMTLYSEKTSYSASLKSSISRIIHLGEYDFEKFFKRCINQEDVELVFMMLEVAGSIPDDLWLLSKEKLNTSLTKKTALIHLIIDQRQPGFVMPNYKKEAIKLLFDVGTVERTENINYEKDYSLYEFRMNQNGTRGLREYKLQPKVDMLLQDIRKSIA